MNTTVPPAGLTAEIDLDVLREKYRRERDKRLRTDGQDQYIEVSGRYGHYLDEDPFTPEIAARDPLRDEVEVLIIGGGWGGLLAAARLREAGIDDIRIVDNGADFGGAWYWNRYPGAQCDIESYCYMPLLEETDYIPAEKYAYAPELFDHARRIGRRFDLYRLACFQTRVTELRWDDGVSRWRVSTNRGDEMMARFVISATGPASRPKLPGIAGLDDFQGESFHTSRWNFAYTGGDNRGNLHKLADKKVAVIGTGATAVQCIPYLGAAAKHLYVFQRTPTAVGRRGNRPTDLDWAAALQPGWQRERQQNFEDIIMGRPFDVDLVDDGWTDLFRNLQHSALQDTSAQAGERTAEQAAALAELADARRMERVRAQIREEVADPKTAELLMPWYRVFCKRPTFNDDFLATFNRPNVTLVDTSASRGVERLTKTGIVANGIEYDVDCIIFATGFETTSAFRRRIGIEIFGRDGKSLYDHWEKGMRTLHGFSVHGFPNWFLVGPSQNAASVNYSGTASTQARHIAFLINSAKAKGKGAIEATAEGEAEWVAEIRRLAAPTKDFLQACTPGYYNNEGQTREGYNGLGGDAYTPGPKAFNDLLTAWRDAGDFRGVEFS